MTLAGLWGKMANALPAQQAQQLADISQQQPDANMLPVAKHS
jgi:hypothetical protein